MFHLRKNSRMQTHAEVHRAPRSSHPFHQYVHKGEQHEQRSLLQSFWFAKAVQHAKHHRYLRCGRIRVCVCDVRVRVRFQMCVRCVLLRVHVRAIHSTAHIHSCSNSDRITFEEEIKSIESQLQQCQHNTSLSQGTSLLLTVMSELATARITTKTATTEPTGTTTATTRTTLSHLSNSIHVKDTSSTNNGSNNNIPNEHMDIIACSFLLDDGTLNWNRFRKADMLVNLKVRSTKRDRGAGGRVRREIQDLLLTNLRHSSVRVTLLHAVPQMMNPINGKKNKNSKRKLLALHLITLFSNSCTTLQLCCLTLVIA